MCITSLPEFAKVFMMHECIIIYIINFLLNSKIVFYAVENKKGKRITNYCEKFVKIYIISLTSFRIVKLFAYLQKIT